MKRLFSFRFRLNSLNDSCALLPCSYCFWMDLMRNWCKWRKLHLIWIISVNILERWIYFSNSESSKFNFEKRLLQEKFEGIDFQLWRKRTNDLVQFSFSCNSVDGKIISNKIQTFWIDFRFCFYFFFFCFLSDIFFCFFLIFRFKVMNKSPEKGKQKNTFLAHNSLFIEFFFCPYSSTVFYLNVLILFLFLFSYFVSGTSKSPRLNLLKKKIPFDEEISRIRFLFL